MAWARDVAGRVVARAAPLALCGRTSALKPGEAEQVVGEVGQPELGRGASKADRADDEAPALLLAGEDMLDRGPDLAARGVPAPAWGLVRTPKPCPRFAAERLEPKATGRLIDRPRQSLQRIAGRRQGPVVLVEIKEPRMAHHRRSLGHAPSESPKQSRG